MTAFNPTSVAAPCLWKSSTCWGAFVTTSCSSGDGSRICSMLDGSQNTVRARIVLPEAYILIKAFALDERQKAKDSYDIHFVLRNYRPNVEALAARVRPLLCKSLAREGYGILKAKFATLDSVGPVWAADVAAQYGENYQQWQRSAFEFAQALFTTTGMT